MGRAVVIGVFGFAVGVLGFLAVKPGAGPTREAGLRAAEAREPGPSVAAVLGGFLDEVNRRILVRQLEASEARSEEWEGAMRACRQSCPGAVERRRFCEALERARRAADERRLDDSLLLPRRGCLPGDPLCALEPGCDPLDPLCGL